MIIKDSKIKKLKSEKDNKKNCKFIIIISLRILNKIHDGNNFRTRRVGNTTT